MKIARIVAMLLFAILILSSVQQVNAGVQFSVTDLGTLGGIRIRPTAVNNNGEVVGHSSTTIDGNEGPDQAFFWSAGVMTGLNSADTLSSWATHINDSGVIVGRAFTAAGSRAFRYDHAGDMTMTYLHNIGFEALTEATGINNAGQITGNGPGGAFVFTSESNWHYLPADGVRMHSARGINNIGQVIGWGESNDFAQRAALYNGTNVMDIGPSDGTSSDAYAVNDLGQVAGWLYNDSNEQHAAIFSNGTAQDLGAMGGSSSTALGINIFGDCVGRAEFGPDPSAYRAFYFDGDHMVDLNSLIDPALGWSLLEATNLNDLGQIVGYGVNGAGQERAFLLTPVPAPGTLGTFGLLALAIKRRRAA